MNDKSQHLWGPYSQNIFKAKSSSQLADLGETNGRVRPHFRTPKC